MIIIKTMNDYQKTTDENNNESISQDAVDLVVARLESIPQNVSISVGGEGSITVEEMIKSVKENSDIGKSIVKMQLDYIRSLKDLSFDEDE